MPDGDLLLLDDNGDALLNEDGDLMLASADADPCCGEEEPWEPSEYECSACGDRKMSKRYTVVMSSVPDDCCVVSSDTVSSLYTWPFGAAHVVKQDPGQHCIYSKYLVPPPREDWVPVHIRYSKPPAPAPYVSCEQGLTRIIAISYASVVFQMETYGDRVYAHVHIGSHAGTVFSGIDYFDTCFEPFVFTNIHDWSCEPEATYRQGVDSVTIFPGGT